MKKNLLCINTGNGKGKTTAAIGTAFRALGHGMKVCIVQFIKGKWKYGELESAKRFEDLLEIYPMGKGFTWESDNINEDIRIAQEAWKYAAEKIMSGEYDLFILDELTYLISYNMISVDEVIEVVTNRPDNCHLIITGRDAHEKLIEVADMVSEINPVKHPYESGIKAQKGIEF